MSNFTKESLNELFADNPEPDYCTIIVRHNDKNSNPASEEIIRKNMIAASNLMDASYVKHYAKNNKNIILFFLNYNKDIFSVRAFVGSLRQVMYTLFQNDMIYVYYSDSFQTQRAVLNEKNYIMDNMHYGLVLSNRRPIPSRFMHDCDKSTANLSPNTLLMLSENLETRQFHIIEETLLNTSKAFDTLIPDNRAYSYDYMLQYIMEVFVGTKYFFYRHNMNYPLYLMPLTEALRKYNGISGLLKELASIIHSYGELFSVVPATEKKQKQINDILNYIDSSITSAELSDTARHFSITPSYLSRIFKESTGITYVEYLKEKRFEKAIEYLQSNNKMSISEICDKLGYKSQSYFQSIFKQKYGTTPDLYRKTYRKNNDN